MNRELLLGQYPKTLPPYKWVTCPSPGEPIPHEAVRGGELETGEISYIGRARIRDQDASGFFTDEDRQLHVSYGCTEHVTSNFEILIVSNQDEVLLWQRCSRGLCPSDGLHEPLLVREPDEEGESMIVGRTCTPLIEGRAVNGDSIQLSRFALTGTDICRPGKIHGSHRCLYVPYSGREYIFTDHEMLMLKKSPGELKDICRFVILKSMTRPTVDSVNKLPLPTKLKEFLQSVEDVSVSNSSEYYHMSYVTCTW